MDPVPDPGLLQRSALAYAAVSAAHVAGIGLVIGAALPMDLRLLGAMPRVPLGVVVPFLSRVAAVGVGAAAATGLALYSVNPAGYLTNPAFRVKMLLLLAALALVAVQHANPAYGRALAGGAVAPSVRVAAAASALLWLAVLFAGRWIGFL